MDRRQPSVSELTVAEFSDRLASAEPVPGGGSASALVGSFAASLLTMVARLSIDRPKYEPYRHSVERALHVGERAREVLLALADDDARAYAAFSQAARLPRDTPEQHDERTRAMQAAARTAADVPLVVVRECGALLGEIESLVGRSNVNAASDLEVAARLCAASARGAASNVLVNLPHVGDERYAGATRVEVGELVQTIERGAAQIVQRVGSGGLREPESA